MQTVLERKCDPELSQIESTVLEQRLADLIRSYVNDRSASLAQTILRHIETLYGHPDFDGDPQQRCVYHRLARHWGWLARSAAGIEGTTIGNRA